METDECFSEQAGKVRRRSAAAATTFSGNSSASPQHGTQNAIIKSLLNKLRLSGSKLKSEKFRFSIPGSASSDTPHNQGKQSDQQDGHVRLSAGVSPFELGRGLPSSQRPSPSTQPVRLDGLNGEATPIAASGINQHLVHAQRNLDAVLAAQQSWGSPRSDAFRVSETGMSEFYRPCSLAGLGSLASSLGGAGGSCGGARRTVRPSNVPPLNLARLGGKEDEASRLRRSRQGLAASPLTPTTPGSAGGQPLTPHQYHQHLLDCLSDLEEELAGWAAPPRWQPASQGRWYLYPPIGRKEVSPVEQLVETLAPNQAAAVVLLWRQYAAARYSAELMAGRAVRLCRELSHELSESRAEVEDRTQRHAGHAAQLGKAIMRLQQQLDEARRAVAAASTAAQAAEPDHQQQLRHQLNQPLPQPGSPTRRRSAHNAATSPQLSHASGRQGEKRVVRASGEGASEVLVAENEDLAAQLEQMRALFLEAHEDSRTLREALMEVDEQNMQLYEQSNGLRCHAAAVLRENDSLRQEVAQLRGLAAGTTTPSGAVGPVPPSAAAPAVSGAVTSVAVRRGRSHHGGKSAGGSETGLRASVSLPLGISDRAAASPAPPRLPPSSTAGAGPTPLSASALKSDGGGGLGRASSARRSVIGLAPEAPSSGAARDPTPPLPPARAASRPTSATRGGSASGGGRAQDHVASYGGAAAADGHGIKMSVGGERGPAGRTFTEALAAEGAVVMVQASRRPSGTMVGGFQTPVRGRVAEAPGLSHSGSFAAEISAAKAAAASAYKGGVGGYTDGALQYGAEDRLVQPNIKVQLRAHVPT